MLPAAPAESADAGGALLVFAGCVIVGKTKTAECAYAAHGENRARGTPHNPWDAAVARWPGGSSSGAGVALSLIHI